MSEQTMSKEKQIEEMREKIRTEISKAVEGGLVTWTESEGWYTTDELGVTHWMPLPEAPKKGGAE